MSTRVSLMALVAVCFLAAAAPASADSISYIKDGNIWLSTPDGSRQFQVTQGGGYSFASQADDGTLIGLYGRRLHRIDRQGTVLADFETPVSGDAGPNNSHFQGPFDPAISPDGTKVAYAYNWQSYYTDPGCTGIRCTYQRLEVGVGYSHADRLTAWDEPGMGRQSGWVHPSWIGNGRTLLSEKAVIAGNTDSILDNAGDGNQAFEYWFSDDNAWYLEDGEISRDGTKAAFVGQQPSADGFRADIIAIYRMNGAAPALPEACYHYTQPNGSFDSPSFSPDGSRIAYAEKHAANPGISVGEVPSLSGGCQMPAAGGSMIIPGGAEPDWGPADVPTGRQVVDPKRDPKPDPGVRPRNDVKVSCAALKGAKRDKCAYKSAVAKCKTIRKKGKRAKCVGRAKRAYAVKKCKRTAEGKALARCLRRARKA